MTSSADSSDGFVCVVPFSPLPDGETAADDYYKADYYDTADTAASVPVDEVADAPRSQGTLASGDSDAAGGACQGHCRAVYQCCTAPFAAAPCAFAGFSLPSAHHPLCHEY